MEQDLREQNKAELLDMARTLEAFSPFEPVKSDEQRRSLASAMMAVLQFSVGVGPAKDTSVAELRSYLEAYVSDTAPAAATLRSEVPPKAVDWIQRRFARSKTQLDVVCEAFRFWVCLVAEDETRPAAVTESGARITREWNNRLLESGVGGMLGMYEAGEEPTSQMVHGLGERTRKHADEIADCISSWDD